MNTSNEQELSTVDSNKKRRRWVNPLNMKRLSLGQFHCMYGELRHNPQKFYEYYQMRIASFDFLVNSIRQHINKRDTNCRDAITVEERLTVTLRYLVTGVNFSALHREFLIGKSTIGSLVRETCVALWNVLQPLEMPTPNKDLWLEKSDLFYERTNFPNCIGAIDGKHLSITNSSTKKYISIILIAIADTNYCFSMIDIGSYDKESVRNIFRQSELGKQLYSGEFDLPTERPLPGTDGPPQPFVLIGNEGFPLHSHLLRPFPARNATMQQRVFNYRLNRGRRFVECAFALLNNRWRVFQTSLSVEPDLIVDIVKAGCVLHNFVRRRDGYIFEDIMSCGMQDLHIRGTGSPSLGRNVRQQFSKYFESDVGSVPWQYQRIAPVT